MEEKKQKWGVSSDTINEINKGIEPMNTSRNIDTERSGAEGIRRNLKPFNLEAAKAGKPVCTRDGRKARIICFDLQSIEKTPIVAAVQVTDKQEVIVNYYENGRQFVDGISEIDLMMLPEKKEGWAVIFKDDLLKTEKEAKELAEKSISGVIKIEKIEYEED